MSRWPMHDDRRAPALGWLAFAAGVAAGVAGGILLSRRPASGGPLPRLTEAWEGASRRLEAMAGALTDAPSLDLEATRVRLAELAGGGDLRLRELTDGILEVVGTAPDVETARSVLEALSREPGVRAVVNRVWTPSSASPGED
ncbi:MAG: hypothetical protein KY453_00175 [Gemmatimonadetes bacterium]|nr:hypothetical protein [Gemmatimonadota bacterium]